MLSRTGSTPFHVEVVARMTGEVLGTEETEPRMGRSVKRPAEKSHQQVGAWEAMVHPPKRFVSVAEGNHLNGRKSDKGLVSVGG